jgi:hypothetical protein
MEPVQIGRDAARTEVILLAQKEDLADYFARRRPWHSPRRPWPVAEAGVTVLCVPPFPFVERLSGNTEAAADPRHIPHGCRLLYDFGPPGHEPGLLSFRHRASSRLY